MKQFSILVVSLFLSNIFAADEKISPSPVVLTVKDAVQKALEHNPGILQTKERLNQGSAVSWLAISKALPTANGTLIANRQKDSSNSAKPKFDGDSYNYYSGQLELSQTLLQRGYLSALFAGGQEKKIREFDLAISERNLSFSVVQSFYRVLLASRQMNTLKKAEDVHKQSLDAAQHRLKIGRGQLLDVLQVKTQLALMAPRIEKAANDKRAAAAELANQLGTTFAESVEVTGKLEAPTMEGIKSKVSEIKSEIPELERIKLLLEQFDNQKAVNIGKHWPQLSLNGNLGRTGYKKSDLTNDSNTAWSVGLKLNIPIFSGLSYFFEKNSLDSEELQLRYQEQGLRNQFALDQVRTAQDLDSAESVVKSSQAAFELADQSVKEAKRQYRVATIDYLQLLNTEQSLLEAELALDQAKFDTIGLLTKYFSALGCPADVLINFL